MTKEQTIIELCEATKFKRLVLAKDAVLISNGYRVDIDGLDIGNAETCAIIKEIESFRIYIERLEFKFKCQANMLERAKKLLVYSVEADKWKADLSDMENGTYVP